MSISIDADDYGRFARAARSAAGELEGNLSKRLRRVGEPLGREVAEGGAREMPSRGGLAARLRRSPVRVTAGAARVEVTLPGNLAALDEGRLRHPVFQRAGRRRVDVVQRVPAGAYSRAFAKVAPAAEDAAQEALADIVTAIARKV